jgi:hypothetical protein
MSKLDVKTIGPALVRRSIAKKDVHPIGPEQNEGLISTPGDNNLKLNKEKEKKKTHLVFAPVDRRGLVHRQSRLLVGCLQS